VRGSRLRVACAAEIAWIVDAESGPMDDSARRSDFRIKSDNVVARSIDSDGGLARDLRFARPRPGQRSNSVAFELKVQGRAASHEVAVTRSRRKVVAVGICSSNTMGGNGLGSKAS
jgi:hypothetical protein